MTALIGQAQRLFQLPLARCVEAGGAVQRFLRYVELRIAAVDADHRIAAVRPFAEILPHGVRTADGQEREVDAIIFGTGFTPSDPLPRGTVFGRDGVDLLDTWPEGPEAYKGTMTAGFPTDDPWGDRQESLPIEDFDALVAAGLGV